MCAIHTNEKLLSMNTSVINTIRPTCVVGILYTKKIQCRCIHTGNSWQAVYIIFYCCYSSVTLRGFQCCSCYKLVILFYGILYAYTVHIQPDAKQLASVPIISFSRNFFCSFLFNRLLITSFFNLNLKNMLLLYHNDP